MSVEKIINQIEIDTDKEVKKILNEAKKQAEIIMKNEQKKAEIQSEIIISNGVKKSDSIKQIIISKENQLAKKSITKTKEKIIEKCFTDAFNKFKNLPEEIYEKRVNNYIKKGINKIGNDCSVKISKEIDKKITKKFGLKLIGQVNSIGGIILISNDGKVTLDYTIEGIIKREKDRIRIKIGKILFK
jgi:V/A-type H+-transporting ATPase subunit E